ncbi:MAG TPA: ABC transporter ATP-binding protein [Candidatus Sulfotelmatobacter sp.]|jgi:ABC-2 type transport system ATP-binding protein|nr:ABC transporter ATP-binding protein [Candidatus Sulfotelmatobacter sp.]
MSEPALLFDGVTRRFGRTVALDGVRLEVAHGTVLGLIGRNGAGKTTALRLALGHLWPDGGRIRTLGLDPVRQHRQVTTRVALLSEESALYPWMTIEEIVRFAGALHPRWDTDLAAKLVKDLDLQPKQCIKELSRGTRAKVALVLAVAARPELLLLDDPTAGLDPLVRREVLEGILGAVSGEGGSVVYASHLVHDVERVADRVVVLDGGAIRLDAGLDDLKARIRRARAVFDQEPRPDGTIPGLIAAEADGRVLTVTADAQNGSLEAALRALGGRDIVIEPLPLEEILVALLREGRKKEAPRV